MAVTMEYEKDVKVAALDGKKIAVIGYMAQVEQSLCLKMGSSATARAISRGDCRINYAIPLETHCE